METLNIKRFLEGNENSFKIECKEEEFLFFKVDVQVANLKYVYAQNIARRGEFINPCKLSENIFLGMYDTEEGFFYEYSPSMREEFCYTIEGLEASSMRMLKATIEAKVQDKIIFKIGLDENKLNLTKDEIEEIAKEVNNYHLIKEVDECLILDTPLNKVKYADYLVETYWYKIDEYIKYIIQGDKHIEYLATKYIENNKKSICKGILELKRNLKLVEQNKNNEEYIVRKNLNNVFGNENYKTLNIKYSNGENELTFKIDTPSAFCNSWRKLSVSKIKDTKIRKEFENTFKATEILPMHIQNITYSRDILYTK